MGEPAVERRRAPAIPLFYLFIAIALRAAAIFRSRYNSDEPQHLHVAWEWARGLVAYRDFYDNHLPLFHMLTAPWMRAVGETPDILLYARLLMIPLVVAVAALTWVLAAELYDTTVAWWAAFAVT